MTTELEEQYRHLFEEVPPIAVVTRAEEGEPITEDCNDLFVDALGYEKSELVVADNGPGIPDQEQETIERGEETPLQYGTGIGLWIVYWTISSYGGEISIEENAPRGTRVVLSLPQGSVDSSPRIVPTDTH